MTHLEFHCSDEKATALLKAARLYDEGVELQPVRHGRWEGVWNGGLPKTSQMHCTLCNKQIHYTDGFLHGFPNYCPNCGAKMDKENQ